MIENQILDALQKGEIDAFPIIKNKENWTKIVNSDFFKPYIDAVEQQADRYRGTNIPSLPFSLFRLVDVTGSREEYETVYFQDHRKRLVHFALLAMMFRREADISELEDILWAICDEYTWALPAHLHGATRVRTQMNAANSETLNSESNMQQDLAIDLFSSETAFALAEITYALEDVLSPIIVSRVKNEVNRRVINSFLVSKWNWEICDFNWAAVCGGSVGAAAIYLVKDEKLLSQIINRLLDTMTIYIDGFMPDGASTEGLAYWNYGFSHFVSFSALLKNRTAGKIDLLDNAQVLPIIEFAEKNLFAHFKTVCFADCLDKLISPTFGLMNYLKQYSPEISPMAWASDSFIPTDPDARWGIAVRNFVWMQPDIKQEPLAPKTSYLPDAMWVASRTESEVGFCIKGGNNDVGSFVLLNKHDDFIVDLGSGLYTMQYFGENRYDILCNSSRGHSVPIVCGNYQLFGSERRSTNFLFDETDDNVNVSMNIEKAYDVEALSSLKRNVIFNKISGELSLCDEFLASTQISDVTERFISRYPAMILEKESIVRLTGKDGFLDIYYDSSICTAVLRSEVNTNHYNAEELITLIDFELKSSSNDFSMKFNFVPKPKIDSFALH